MSDLLPASVYILCALASFTCAALLARSYRRNPASILFWSALSFALLTINNIMLVMDLVLFPDISMRTPRLIASFAAGAVLVFGFIWDMEE